MNDNAVNQIQKVLQAIEDNLDHEIERQDLIRMSYFSSAAFYPLFQNLVGTSLKDYVQRRRLSASCRNLIESDASILSIALEYQYASYESYSRAFKRLTGLSPRKYRKRGQLTMPFGRISLIETHIEGDCQMERRMNQALVKERLADSAGILLDIDVDDFDRVNQQYGKAAGDYLLAEIPNRINRVLRDHGVSQQAIRIHNDEFLASIPNHSDRTELIEAKIMEEIRRPYHYQEMIIQITVSIGITPYQKHQDWSESLNRAEAAMKEAKHQGKNQIYQK